jgi:putative membrane protein
MKLIAWCAVLALPVLAFAASSPDEHFYKALAEGGLAEVEAGQLAQQKSSDPQIVKFAAMMVKDHSAANEQLKALADSKGISLPSKPGMTQMAEKAKLDMLSGDTFNKSYIKNQVASHQDTIKLLRKEIASGQDADAKAFAQKILPTVRSHLKAIDEIADGAGIKH